MFVFIWYFKYMFMFFFIFISIYYVNVIEKKSYLLHQFCIRHVQAQDANMVQIIGCEPWFFKNFVFNTRFKM
jgi:hypothetical protein